MKQITFALFLFMISIMSFSQEIITPTGIEIGDMNKLPNYSPINFDGPIKIVHSTESNGSIIAKNTDPNKIAAFQALNDIDNVMVIGIGGSTRPNNFDMNCAMLKTSTAYSNVDLRYFVIGNADNLAPIVFVQNDQEVVRIDNNGNVEVSNPNTGIILTSPNGTKFKITVDDSGVLTTNQSTSTKSATITTNVKIYPNPSANQLTINLNDQPVQSVNASIYDLTGNMIFTKSYKSNTFQIYTSDLEKGAYLLQINDDKGNLITTKNFIKQ